MENLNAVVESIKGDLSSGNIEGFFENLMLFSLMEEPGNEIDIFSRHQGPIAEIMEQLPALKAVSAIFNKIAPCVKQAISKGVLKKYKDGEKSQLIFLLDIISLHYAASFEPDCVGYGYSRFVARNGEKFSFWRWFRAYLPADCRILGIQSFRFHPAFVLPSILISNPHDLRFYKELCLELAAINPEYYAEISIEPEIVEAIVAKAIALKAGQDVPRRAVPMSSVKNNFFIADFLR
ncbi:MAG: hypothetical protein AB1403_12335 [Candidatus Riflebacteria bacterium]